MAHLHINWNTPIEERERLYLEAIEKNPEDIHDHLLQFCFQLLQEKMYTKLLKYINLGLSSPATDKQLSQHYYMLWLYWSYQDKDKESLPALIKAVELDGTY